MKLRLYIFILLFVSVHNAYSFTPRITKQEVQLGVSGVSSYGRPIFANAMYGEPRGWKSTNETAFPLQAAQIGTDGYPTYLTAGQNLYVQPGQNSVLNAPAYGGRICITWEGDADINVLSANYLGGSTATGSVVNGKRYYNNGTKPNGVYVKISSINPANPPKNIKIWLNDLRNPTLSLDPAEQGGKEYLIHPSFTQLFGTDVFTLYRFMNLTETIGSKIVNWADRRMPNHCFQKGPINSIELVGICYEKAIQIANDLGKDMWINIPPMANQNFVENLARLINGDDPDGTGCPGLNKDLRCFVEWGNEMGWSYWIPECNAWGTAEVPAISGRQYAGRQQARVTSWFRNIVGANNEQYKFIHAIQTSELSNSDKELEQSCTLFGPTLTPSGKPDFIGITSYFGSKIEQYVFDNINYWDASVQATELDKTFRELELRTISLSSSTTGVDYTGGGIPAITQSLRAKYSIPFMIYEGGCGLNLASNQTTIDCKIVPKGTAGGTLNVFLNNLAEPCHTNGKVLFTNFIKAIHSDYRMSKMLEINNTIVKSIGVETMSQFGEVADPAAGIDYGYWGCKTAYNQDPAISYRYNFWNDWYQEQKSIREVGVPIGVGGAPFFKTEKIEPVLSNIPFIREVLIDGGDGSIQAKMINRTDILPQGISFSYDAINKKIIISGSIETPGSYNFLYRILDADNDPAFKIFNINCLKNLQNAVYAYDDFGTSDVDNVWLSNLATGNGFSSNWLVSTASYTPTASTNFVQRNVNPLLYPIPHILPSLKCSGGSKAESIPGANTPIPVAQRALDVSKFDYLKDTEDVEYIGEKGTSLWCSMLYHRPNINNSTASSFEDIFRFNSKQGGFTFRHNAEIILVAGIDGKYRLDCHPVSLVTTSGSAFTTIPTNITATQPETQLLVFEFKFGIDTDTVRFYHNPTQFGVEKPNVLPAATYVTDLNEKVRIAKFIFVGNNSSGKSNESMDDLRFGDSYAAVTPIEPAPDTEAPSTPTNFAVSEIVNNSVTLTWNASTDNIAVVGYEVYYNNNKIATISGLSKTITGLPAGSHCFYIKALDQVGIQSLPTSTLCRSGLTTIYTYPVFEGVKVFPNPVNESFAVSLNNNFECIDVEVFNATGNLLLKKVGVVHNQIVDINYLEML